MESAASMIRIAVPIDMIVTSLQVYKLKRKTNNPF